MFSSEEIPPAPRAVAIAPAPVSGIVWMLCAVAVFAAMDVTMKQLATTYSVFQVAFIRGVASLPLILLAVVASGNSRQLAAVNWKIHLLRGVLGAGILVTFVYALRVLPMSDAYAICLSAPLLMTALSVWILREQVSWKKWVAIAVGLGGVLIILLPTGSGWLTLGGLAALATAVQYALSSTLIRVLAPTDSALATVFWTMLISTLTVSALAARAWIPIQFEHWSWIAGLGITGALAQYLLTLAFRAAPAAIVAPFEYTGLLWALALDWLLWATSPSTHMLAGAVIVVASGIYVLHQARRHA